MSTDAVIFYQGECQLLQWSETSSRGRTATFQFGEEGDSHPFADARTKQGKMAGQRFALVLVAINDDEQPVRKTSAQLAFLYCKDEMFWQFCDERAFTHIHDEDTARAYVLEGCGVKSRSELDKDPAARSMWLTQFENPFGAYRAATSQVI